MRRRLYKIEKWGEVVWKRSRWRPWRLVYDPNNDRRKEVDSIEKANAISSRVDTGRYVHMPAIDIDHPCRLVRSSTPGHHHLYVDVPMAWWRYRLLLWAMVRAGIVEPGYYRCAVARRATYLRAPGHFKEGTDLRQREVVSLLQMRDDLDPDSEPF